MTDSGEQWGSWEVAEYTDDGNIFVTGSSHSNFNNSSTIVFTGSNGSGQARWGWFRVANIEIPQGSTIDYCQITYRPHYTRHGDEGKTFTVHGVDIDNYAAPSSSGDVYGATLTSASTTFTVSGSNWARAVNVKTIVQEIINRSGWSVNNAIGFIMKPVSTGLHYHNIYSRRDGTSHNHVRLQVRWFNSSTITGISPAEGSASASVGNVFVPTISPDPASCKTKATVGSVLVDTTAYPSPDPATAITSGSVIIADAWDAFKPSGASAVTSAFCSVRNGTIINFVRLLNTYTGIVMYQDEVGKIFYKTGINQSAPPTPTEGTITNMYHMKDVRTGRLIYQDSDGDIKYKEGY